MNPPLRSASDREASWWRWRTVHRRHRHRSRPARAARKDCRVRSRAVRDHRTGDRLAWRITKLHREQRILLARIVELFSAGPARVVDLQWPREPGARHPADVTIFDPKKRWTFEAAKSRSKSRNTPFDGWQLTGKVVATRGRAGLRPPPLVYCGD